MCVERERCMYIKCVGRGRCVGVVGGGGGGGGEWDTNVCSCLHSTSLSSKHQPSYIMFTFILFSIFSSLAKRRKATSGWSVIRDGLHSTSDSTAAAIWYIYMCVLATQAITMMHN